MGDSVLQECAKRKCKWRGYDTEMILVPTKGYTGSLGMKDYTCPVCGNNEFYVIKEKGENDG